MIVHGVGSQPESETLRWFGGPLTNWLAAWHRQRCLDGFRIESSHLSYGEHLKPEEPARVDIHIPAYDGSANESGHTSPAQHWIVAEAWWASRLEAPTLRRMLEWLRTSAARVLVPLIQLPGNRPAAVTDAMPRGLAGVIDGVNSALLIATYLVGAVVLVIPLLVLYFLSLLPVEILQKFILTKVLGGLLVSNIGDFEVYVDDEIQALHIRHRLEETIDWLVTNQRCKAIVVVGHSQGTVIAFDALGGHHLRHHSSVKRLITVGSALNDAWQLAPQGHRLQTAALRGIPWLDVWSVYDPVHGRVLARPQLALQPPPEQWVVTNRMNVRTEHGDYWRNGEQVLAKIATEIELAGGAATSRYEAQLTNDRFTRRKNRVAVLTLWRLVAVATFWVIFFSRVFEQQSVGDIGRTAWAWIQGAPFVRPVLDGALGLPTSVALPKLLTRPLEFGLGTLILIALVESTYLFVAAMLFDAWERMEVCRETGPDNPQPNGSAAIRTTLAIGMLVVLAGFGLAASIEWLLIAAIAALLAALLTQSDDLDPRTNGAQCEAPPCADAAQPGRKPVS